MRTIIEHTCDYCHATFDVTFHPGEIGRRGHLDNWTPDWPDEVVPDQCPECGCGIQPEDVTVCHE